uniref:Uncharacterized protein n=1 Tax=Labrus bergylta TaxID=56723 RepID=A0A3Q3E3Y7_9LABR
MFLKTFLSLLGILDESSVQPQTQKEPKLSDSGQSGQNVDDDAKNTDCRCEDNGSRVSLRGEILIHIFFRVCFPRFLKKKKIFYM